MTTEKEDSYTRHFRGISASVIHQMWEAETWLGMLAWLVGTTRVLLPDIEQSVRDDSLEGKFVDPGCYDVLAMN